MMNIFSLCACGIISCVLIVTIRQYKPEMAIGVSVAAGVVMFTMLAAGVVPVIGALTDTAGKIGVNGEYILISVKAVGICLVAQLAADICRDSGQQSAATKIEIGGKLAVVAVSLPLFEQLLTLAERIITE